MAINIPFASAQTQEEVDQAKRAEAYETALQNAAKARQAAAEADAAASTALAKAQTEVDDAKAKYYKSLLTPPDPTKYSTDKPDAPKLTATYTRLAFEDAEKLGAEIATKIKTDLGLTSCSAADRCVLLPEDTKTRTLISLSRALRETLEQARTRLAGETAALKRAKDTQPAPLQKFALAAPAGLAAVSALGETVLAFAKILKTQYAYGTDSQKSLADKVLLAKVGAALIDGKSGIQFIEPDALVALFSASGQQPEELARLKTLQDGIAAARKLIAEADTAAADKREEAAAVEETDGKVMEKRAALVSWASTIETQATLTAAAVAEVDKLLATLYTADTLGNTILDSALRGGLLEAKLAAPAKAYLLKVTAESSDIDTIASDHLIWGLRIRVASTTVASWRLTGIDGVVRSVGAVKEHTPLSRVNLSD